MQRNSTTSRSKPSKVSLAPPDGNTGAQNTNSIPALVDYLRITWPDGTKLEQVFQFFGGEGWIEMPHGNYGYSRHLRRGHVSIYSEGREGMGVHVEASGQGCRELEALRGMDRYEWEWGVFLGLLIASGAKFSRLDLAFDDVDRLTNMAVVQASVESGELVSRWKKGRIFREVELADGATGGETFYFGSRMSDTMLRVYDKGKQIGSESFLRWELEAKRDKAQALARLLAQKHRRFEVLASVMRGLLDFKAPGQRDPNKSRWVSAGWWEAFLCRIAGARLTVAPVIRSVEKVVAWVSKSVAPSLALLMAVAGGDLEFLVPFLEDGRLRWGAWHKELLARATLAGVT